MNTADSLRPVRYPEIGGEDVATQDGNPTENLAKLCQKPTGRDRSAVADGSVWILRCAVSRGSDGKQRDPQITQMLADDRPIHEGLKGICVNLWMEFETLVNRGGVSIALSGLPVGW